MVSEESALDMIKMRVIVDGEMVEVLSAPGQSGAFELICDPVKAQIVQVEIKMRLQKKPQLKACLIKAKWKRK